MAGENVLMSLGNVITHIQRNGKQPQTQIPDTGCNLTTVLSLNLEIC